MLEKDEVKETILDVASTIFSKFGFKKTTMDEIAQAARKGKSSVYYYFSGKEEIFKAVVEREGLLLKNTLMEVVLSDLLPEEKLRKYILTRLLAIKELSNLDKIGTLKELLLSTGKQFSNPLCTNKRNYYNFLLNFENLIERID